MKTVDPALEIQLPLTTN